MTTRKIGKLNVSAIGYGCMGLSHGYGATPIKDDAVKLIRTAYEMGCTFFDTAEGYALGQNEELVGEAIRPIRNHIVLASKFGGPIVAGDHLEPEELTPAEIRKHCEASLRRLGTECKGDDVRRFITRFEDDNVRKNQPLLELLDDFATRKNATYAQIALAWLLATELDSRLNALTIYGNRTDEDIVFHSDTIKK